MSQKTSEALASELRERRESIFQRVAETEEDVSLIAGLRDSELEERAQDDRLVRLLSKLDARGRREIEAIDAALQRLQEGRYGECLSCGERISAARLRVLPTATLCHDCAEAEEHRLRTGGRAEDLPASPGGVPPELATLSDPEQGLALRELVREDGRVDMEELRIVVRHGLVHLHGALPSEAEHQILLGLVKDVAGMEDVDDHLEIQELAWEREEATEEEPPVPDEARRLGEPTPTDEAVDAGERGVDWEPPSSPTAEEEPEEP